MGNGLGCNGWPYLDNWLAWDGGAEYNWREASYPWVVEYCGILPNEFPGGVDAGVVGTERALLRPVSIDNGGVPCIDDTLELPQS